MAGPSVEGTRSVVENRQRLRSSTVRSLLSWAHEKEQVEGNVAKPVRQPEPCKVDGREKGDSDAEAVAALRAS